MYKNYKAPYESSWELLLTLLIASLFAVALAEQRLVYASLSLYEALKASGYGAAVFTLEALSYLSIPVTVLIRTLWASLFLWLGCWAWGLPLPFTVVWRVCVAAMFAFLAGALTKFLYFYFQGGDPAFNEVYRYYPFALSGLFEQESLGRTAYSFLTALNLFEVLFMVLAARFLHKATGRKTSVYWPPLLTFYLTGRILALYIFFSL